MISDEKLASLAVGPTPEQEKVVRNVVRPVISEGAAVSHALQFLQDVSDMAQELLAYREAERKAKSWDDTEAWVQTRRKVTEFYDNTGHLRGKFYGEPEERPK